MDVEKKEYQTLEDLNLYCYRVAGVVGLMMVHIMGISDEKALKNAADLGIAMQMTNIARDVLDDFGLGRVYLPLSWLTEIGMGRDQVGQAEFRSKLASGVKRLVDEAQSYYESGRQGIAYLPWRAALAVSAACSVYSQIGHAVVTRGPRAWDSRTIVPQWKKVIALFGGVVEVVKSLPRRWVNPWNSVPIQMIWRHL